MKLLPALIAVLAIAPATSTFAAGTVTREGSTLTFVGSGGADAVDVEFSEKATYGGEGNEYVFNGNFTKLKQYDGSITAGEGCRPMPPPFSAKYVTCSAAGIEHVEIDVNGGGDFVNAGGESAIPAIVTVHGGPGADNLFADEKAPSGDAMIAGDDGNDHLTEFSRSAPVHMVGGLGNDTFVWEGTNPGTATFADGGPGDDEFSSENAKGPDTIVTGSGWDTVKVHNKSGDPDTVTCGPDGLAAIYFNPSDHIDKNCRLNAFAASLPLLTKALRRLRPAKVANSSAIRLQGLRVPLAGTLRATLRVVWNNGYGVAARGTLGISHAGPLPLVLQITRGGHKMLRSATYWWLDLTYRSHAGSQQKLTLHS